MYISILFKNDAPQIAYVDPSVAERERAAKARQSDGSIDQGIFHVKSVLLVGTLTKGRG